MSSDVKSLDGKSRLLSPKSRSSQPFKGQLVVLDNPNAVSLQQKVKSPDAEKKSKVKRPSSGSLEVLKSEKKPTVQSQNESSRYSKERKTSSGRREKRFPGVQQKEECTCQGETICKKCIQQKMQDLSIHSNEREASGMRIQENKADKLPMGKIPVLPVSSTIEYTNTEQEDTTSSSEESDSDENQGNGGNGSNPQSVPSNDNAKAPVELLGRFLSALMKKEYEEAQTLCEEILQIEPENATCLEFRGTLEEKLKQDDEESSSEEESSESEDEDSSANDSDDSDEENSSNDEKEESESDEEFDISNLNLIMGGVPIRK